MSSRRSSFRTDWRASFKRFVETANLSVDQATRLVALKLHDRIVMRTPVDTGRARASWNIAVGDKADLSVASPRGGLQTAAEKAMLKTDTPFSAERVPPARAYVISNNLVYITALEDGHSKQAPAGMVKLAIADVRTELEAHGRISL